MKHEHRWSFLGELALSLSEQDLRQGMPSLRRIEYCVECGSIRVQFDNRWAHMESTTTKKFLSQFETTEDTVLPEKPTEIFASARVTVSKQRLGRGLSDLMKQVESHGTKLSLLPGGKGPK
jgi:hypothetical protein